MRGRISGLSVLVVGTLLAAYGVFHLGQVSLPQVDATVAVLPIVLALVAGLWVGKVQRDRRKADVPAATAIIIPFTPRSR